MRDPKVIAKLEKMAAEAAKSIPSGVQPEDQQAFNIGASFHIAALRCGESRKLAGKIQSPTSPMIVNFAFAIELYFKSLLIASNGTRRGHDLQVLFNSLRDTDRQEIEKRFEALNGRDAKQLADDLASYARAFEEWRYLFETRRVMPIAVYSLSDLARVCFLMINERHPGWADEATVVTLSPAPDDKIVCIINLSGGVMVRAVHD
ncbi:hypothetical protein FJ960_00530 [Mesorhizobium sp. B2-3-11]|uniref:hypothetical protein n=1 Tax=Mesorhizobium sp. B2-3-11 TaxID=2589953 RepID=UPI00112DDACD|nr:hypothetical protein [Mesorhizobium sp. B2-3-11]TPM11278.1 hypothetical protein FJ960_00530 [Mesorhizobium sp. B2-3-11]